MDDYREIVKELAASHTAMQSIHKLLNGVEWSPDTLEEIGEIIEGLGLEILNPDEFEEEVSESARVGKSIFVFPAEIFITMENYAVTRVTVLPENGTDIRPFDSAAEATGFEFEYLDQKLGEYLEQNVVSKGVESPHYLDATFALSWEG